MKGTRPLDNDEIRTAACSCKVCPPEGASVNETEIIKRYIQKINPYKHWGYSTFNAIHK